MEFCLAYMTFPHEDEATKMAKRLLQNHLIACANIFSGGQSLYWWEGKIQSEAEVYMLAKTTVVNKDAITSMVCDNHPNQCPCVVFVPLQGGNPAFYEWLASQTENKHDS